MQVETYSDTRKNLKAIMDRMVEDSTSVLAARQRGELVVMVSLDDWNSIQETLYLLSTAANARALMEGIAQLDAGLGEEHELIDPDAEA